MRLSKTEVRQYIEDFVRGSGGRWDWDDFISVPIDDPELESVRVRCVQIAGEYPPTSGEGYCSSEGMAELVRLAESLEESEG
jgi:hypothetical protein